MQQMWIETVSYVVQTAQHMLYYSPTYSMKDLIPWLVIVIVVLVGGYFLFFREVPSDPSPDISSFEGTVINVNRDAVAADGPIVVTIETDAGEQHVIAVPSMGLPFCAALGNIADVSILAVGDQVSVSGTLNEERQIIPCEDAAHYLQVMSFMLDATLGYEFSYRKGPDGYVTFENNESRDVDFTTGVLLMNQREYEELQASTLPREGPPTIRLRVYENPENLSAAIWTLRKPQESNIERTFGEPGEAVVGGANAVHYVADGLYPTETYVIAHGGRIYMLEGSYLEEFSRIQEDFHALLSSFTFVPTPGH